MSDPICGHCGYAISGSSMRHFGTFVAHFEEDCRRLMKEKIDDLERSLTRMQEENEEQKKTLKEWKKEVDLLTHKIITCGVAADHSNAELANTGAYIEKWDSPQAQKVRALRKRADKLRLAGEELLACEEMRLRIEELGNKNVLTVEENEEYCRLIPEYNRRLPMAWEKLREALK